MPLALGILAVVIVIGALAVSSSDGPGRYFTWAELTRSETAKTKGLDNTPTALHRRRLASVVRVVLDPFREWTGRAINTESGYRHPDVNRALEPPGAENSDHTKGYAVDISQDGKSNEQLAADFIRAHRAGKIATFDKIIYYAPGRVGSFHVSYRDDKPNRELVYFAPAGTTDYVQRMPDGV